jgi:hypothetical protein
MLFYWLKLLFYKLQTFNKNLHLKLQISYKNLNLEKAAQSSILPYFCSRQRNNLGLKFLLSKRNRFIIKR